MCLLIAVLSLVAVESYGQLGGVLKKVKDKAPEAPGTGTFDKGAITQPDACISNVEGRLKSINESYYPKFQSDAKSYLSSPSALWFPRKDFEAARYYFTGGQQGYGAGGRQCETGAATADPRYQELKKKMEEAETKVKEMEKAKGYEFVAVRDNNIIFKDVKTGKELSADDCARL